MMKALPTNFKLARKSDLYTEIQQGENKFRIIGPGFEGYQIWDKDSNTSVRVKPEAKEGLNLRYSDKPQQFFIFPVWNYTTNRLELYSIVQRTVLKEFERWEKSGKSLFDFDIKVLKAGIGKESNYMVVACEPSTLSADIIEKCLRKPLYIDAHFEGKYPDIDKVGEACRFYFEPEKKTTQIDISGLKSMLDECHPSYQEELKRTLAMMQIPSIDMITPSLYEIVMPVVKSKRAEHLAFLADEEKFVAQ